MIGMTIAFHGGKCCGIRHIYNMGNSPDAAQPALSSISGAQPTNDASGQDVSSDLRVFRQKAPAETGKERLQRYLDFLAEFRPKGLVEICLAAHPSAEEKYAARDKEKDGKGEKCPCGCGTVIGGRNWGQVTWFETLEEMGFTRVAKFRNSNSGNDVSIFHLIMDGDVPEDDEEEDY